MSIANAENVTANPRWRAKRSIVRTPRAVSPSDAAARLIAITSCSAIAANGCGSSSRIGSEPGAGRCPRHSSSTNSTGPAAAPSAASTTITAVAATAVRGADGRRAGANAPAHTSSAPTSIPVRPTGPRGPAPGSIASIAASAALVSAITARPAAITSRSSRRPSRQPRRTIAVATSPMSAVPVSSATCSDGAS